MRNGQNGRRRGRGGPRLAPGANRTPDVGNRMEVRVRGNAHQLLEKYKSLARDATSQGDRVTAEYYMQYADHYYRVLNEFRPRHEEHQRPRRDFMDDVEEALPEVAEMAPRAAQPAVTDEAEDVTAVEEPAESEHSHRERGRRGRPPRQPVTEAAPAESVPVEVNGAEVSDDIGGDDERPRRRRGRPRTRRDDDTPELALIDA